MPPVPHFCFNFFASILRALSSRAIPEIVQTPEPLRPFVSLPIRTTPSLKWLTEDLPQVHLLAGEPHLARFSH